jgi:co-chaperonin GroES (HSP10)
MQAQMMEFNVLIDQDEVREQTKGGLFIPQERQERDKHAQTWGRIVAMSPMCFNEDIWTGDKPKAGDRVYFAKHAGAFVEIDDREYRVVKDKDIVAVLR